MRTFNREKPHRAPISSFFLYNILLEAPVIEVRAPFKFDNPWTIEALHHFSRAIEALK
jgi:hypothetical protein